MHNATHWFIFSSNTNLIFSSLYLIKTHFISFQLWSLFGITWSDPNMSSSLSLFFYFFSHSLLLLSHILLGQRRIWMFFQFGIRFMISAERRLVTNNLDRFHEISDHNWAYLLLSVQSFTYISEYSAIIWIVRLKFKKKKKYK